MVPLRDHLPTRSVPYVNYAIIVANLIVFGIEFHVGASGGDIDQWVTRWALVPSRFLAHPGPQWFTLFTHMFLHAGLAHVAGNMLYLWIFGDNVEDVLGHWRYLLFYILCGLCAAFAQIAVSRSSDVAMMGASGAIAGVLAAYGVSYPMSPITTLNPIPIFWLFWGPLLWFPAWLIIAEFFIVNVVDALGSARSATAGGVAFVAHIGGFVAGLALLPLLRINERREYEPWQGWRQPVTA